MGCFGGGGDNKVKETPEEKELARIATEQFEIQERVFKPLEDDFIRRVDNIGEGEADLAAGATSADIASQAETAFDRGEAGAMGRGAVPGSGAFAERVTDTGDAAAQATGFGVASAERGVTDQRLAGKQAAVQIGLGKEATAVQGITDIARRAHQDAVFEAKQDVAISGANKRALGRAAGFGADRYLRTNDAPGGVAPPPMSEHRGT